MENLHFFVTLSKVREIIWNFRVKCLYLRLFPIDKIHIFIRFDFLSSISSKNSNRCSPDERVEVTSQIKLTGRTHESKAKVWKFLKKRNLSFVISNKYFLFRSRYSLHKKINFYYCWVAWEVSKFIRIAGKIKINLFNTHKERDWYQ